MIAKDHDASTSKSLSRSAVRCHADIQRRRDPTTVGTRSALYPSATVHPFVSPLSPLLVAGISPMSLGLLHAYRLPCRR